MSAETELGSMQAGIQQLLPDLTTLSILSSRRTHSQGVNQLHSHHTNLQPNGKFIFSYFIM